ncbi:MAG: methyltransferase domain-containing protein [Myxococcales bacterium]|nr:methyltransferase domain-containing protein [Myxococcales bacterium]
MGSTHTRTLDVGCGRDKLPGAVGIDKNPRSHADIIHDLDVRPWPIEDDSFDEVRALDVLEHVDDFIGCVEEMHRVCRDGATIRVRMPFISSVDYFTDPTHKRAGTARTFDYFDPTTALGRYRYSAAELETVSVRYQRGTPFSAVGAVFGLLDLAVVPLANRFKSDYERHFAFWYPMVNVEYVLRVKKPSR